MGSSASKASRAAGSAARKYPTSAAAATNASSTSRPAPAASSSPAAGAASTNPRSPPPVRPQAAPAAAGSRTASIDLDASDPDFARSLRSLGPVQPNPTLSPTSAFPSPHNSNPNAAAAVQRSPGPDPRSNPALVVLDARAKLRDEAEKEFEQAGRRGHPGRQFLDVHTIRQILLHRDAHARTAPEIERVLGLRPGVVERLGQPGILSLAREVASGKEKIEMV